MTWHPGTDMMGGVRILSLLPSATEIACLLGLESSLVGVTHECDWPPSARGKPRVTRSLLPKDAKPSEIDKLVSTAASGGAPTYWLDQEAIAGLRPDVVLTQDLCAVCAVPRGHLEAALESLGLQADVVSLDPSSIADVLADIEAVGRATGTEVLAKELTSALADRLEAVGRRVAGAPRPRVLALEWGDPPYNAGHWVPEMVERAGGEALLGEPGAYSRRVSWQEVAGAEPEVVVFMPCGYNLEAACAEGRELEGRAELAGAERFFAAASGGYFSRPGPRLVDGVEALAEALHGSGEVPGVLALLR
jgi:iron complex transport system substrate-binding protein